MKERIAQAAVHEIRQRGLKFSIRDVVSQLGISTKTFYQYYESKEELVTYIVEAAVRDMREAEAELMKDDSLSTAQKLQKALVIIPRGFVFTDMRVLQELQQRYPAQWRIVDAYMNNGWDNIRLLVQEGSANGEFRSFDLELFIRVYVGALYHLMDNQVAGRNEMPIEKALVQMVEFLLVGIFKDGNTVE